MALTKSFVQNAATTPVDGRFMLAGMLQKKADNTVRVGQLWGGSADVTATTASAPMTVQVAAGSSWALSRGYSDGAVIVANNGAATANIADAPNANSRYDLVWMRHNDSTVGDADSNPVFGVTTGTAAASPTVPTAPSGALALATVLVPAGVTTTSASGVTITNVYPFAAVSGSPIRYRNTTELNADIGNVLDGVQGYVKGGELYWARGGAWSNLSNGDTGWTTITLPSGLTGTSYSYRRLNGVVYLRGSVAVNSGTFANGYTAAGTLPAGFRPTAYLRTPISMFNGYVGNVVIGTDGTIQIGASGDRTADTVYLASVAFPAA